MPAPTRYGAALNAWQVTADLDLSAELDDDQEKTLLSELQTFEPAVGSDDVFMSITLTIELSSTSPVRAGELGMQAVTRAVACAGGRVARWRGVEALTADEAAARLRADVRRRGRPQASAREGAAARPTPMARSHAGR